MEEERTFYLRQMNNLSSADNVTSIVNASVVLTNVTASPIPVPSAPLLSTDTCAYIHGGILATLFIIAMTR